MFDSPHREKVSDILPEERQKEFQFATLEIFTVNAIVQQKDS